MPWWFFQQNGQKRDEILKEGVYVFAEKEFPPVEEEEWKTKYFMLGIDRVSYEFKSE